MPAQNGTQVINTAFAEQFKSTANTFVECVPVSGDGRESLTSSMWTGVTLTHPLGSSPFNTYLGVIQARGEV